MPVTANKDYKQYYNYLRKAFYANLNEICKF